MSEKYSFIPHFGVDDPDEINMKISINNAASRLYPGLDCISMSWNDEPTIEVNTKVFDLISAQDSLLADWDATFNRKLLAKGYMGTFEGFHLVCPDLSDLLHEAKISDKVGALYTQLLEFRKVTHGITNNPQITLPEKQPFRDRLTKNFSTRTTRRLHKEKQDEGLRVSEQLREKRHAGDPRKVDDAVKKMDASAEAQVQESLTRMKS